MKFVAVSLLSFSLASSCVAQSASPALPLDAALTKDLGKSIPRDSKVFLAPMDGYETFLAAALTKKGVPVSIVSDRSQADFEIKGSSESQKAGVAKMLVMGSAQSHEEASITVTNIQSSVLVFAYEVNKGNSVHGKQSTAEACAKHLKEKIESGK